MSRMDVRIRFLPLPQAASRWRSFVLSFLLQVPLLASVAAFAGSEWVVSQRLQSELSTRRQTQVTWVQAAPPPVEVSAPPRIKAAPLEAPPPSQVVAPLIASPQLESVPLKAPQLVASLEPPRLPAKQPEPKLQPPVKTGVFGGGSAASPTLPPMPAQKVQTGGFGDSNGVEFAGPAAGNGKLVVASLGNFDLPSGPGYGNGTGGASGARGVVPSAGFGDRTAAAPRPVPQTGRIQATNFTPVVEAPKAIKKAEGPVDVPVSILDKPTPVYTREARELRLEGEVLLEVVFTAHGQVRVVRVLRGLGHGLDEAAVNAAQKIHFTPAQREKRAVDTTATLHIVFQLS